jgi:hypothetical protein
MAEGGDNRQSTILLCSPIDTTLLWNRLRTGINYFRIEKISLVRGGEKRQKFDEVLSGVSARQP